MDKKTSTNISCRAPIVVVLGHVDHGKTTLLDKIRSANVAGREAGAITQHIGAYQVGLKNDQKITFIDTPGHAAFAQMRSRGAKVADIGLLVVSAEESVKPQTLESLRFIQEEKLNYLVVITKTDLPNADIAKVKNDLVKAGVLLEGFGGDTPVVPVSAKTGQGIDDLLEMILLLNEMNPLPADPAAPLEAVVVESRLDPCRGPLATIIVRNGSLKVGDLLWAGGASAKIKALFDDLNHPLKSAFPGQPVEALGFQQVPAVGEKVTSEAGDRLWQSCPVDLANLSDQEKQKLRLILRSDTLGTLEAIMASLPSQVLILKAEPGNINETDVIEAAACGAVLVGFNLKVGSSVKKLAQTEGVKILIYQTIYQLIDELQKQADSHLKPETQEEELGRATVIAEFLIDKKERVAGARVDSGQIHKTAPVRLERGDQLICRGRIKTLKKGKLEADKAVVGEEFGASFTSEFDFTIGDMLISYRKT